MSVRLALECSPMRDEFRSTHWSAVLAAGNGSSPEAQRALATLCEIYWFPLYAYARRRVANVHEAQDLTQAFFAELLEKNYVGTATPDRGRFRAFLLTAFKHFLSKQWEKGRAQKRGGGRAPISLDFAVCADSRLHIEPADSASRPNSFTTSSGRSPCSGRSWNRLQTEFEQAGKGLSSSLS